MIVSTSCMKLEETISPNTERNIKRRFPSMWILTGELIERQ